MSNLPAIIVPSFSQPLFEAVTAASNPHPDAGFEALPAYMRPEAETAEQRLNAALAPASAEVIARWLAPLASIVSFNDKPSPADLRAKIMAAASFLTDLPGCCWTPATQRDAAREFKWWPTPSEIEELVMPSTAGLRAQRAALSRLLRAQPKRGAPEERETETDDQRSANAAKNAATVQTLKDEWAGKQKAATPVVPNHISPAHRIAEYRRMGQHAVADAIARHHGMDDTR